MWTQSAQYKNNSQQNGYTTLNTMNLTISFTDKALPIKRRDQISEEKKESIVLYRV